jgi:hypothetical protein
MAEAGSDGPAECGLRAMSRDALRVAMRCCVGRGSRRIEERVATRRGPRCVDHVRLVSGRNASMEATQRRPQCDTARGARGTSRGGAVSRCAVVSPEPHGPPSNKELLLPRRLIDSVG